ncbi:MAG: hypothetical protein QG649_690 [Patescibacteria group bacterium]|jgi:hypothetical protein|nr:hypothetical protein [Patescibacteria group bacterium]
MWPVYIHFTYAWCIVFVVVNKINISNRSILILGALSLLIGSLFALPVSAVDANVSAESILLSPTNKRYELQSGQTKRDSFKVVNNGGTAYTFFVYARPYSVDNENYDVNFDSDVANADAYKWVQFDTTSFQLKPGDSVDVSYTLRVPENATPGGHYGVLFAETQPAEQNGGTVIAQKKRVGAILYTTVDGTVTRAGKYLGQDVPFFQFSAPLKVRQRISNSGNTDFTVRSSVSVSDIFGGLKYKNEKEATILPAKTRSINNDWPMPAWIGVYKVEQTAQFLDEKRTSTNYVLLIPVWVYITTVLLIGGRVLYAVVQRKSSKK